MDRETYVRAYFALMEAGELLRHHVEQQLRRDGDLSYVQFRLLAQLADAADGSVRMTDLADAVVYSRSGIGYQVRQLEREGLLTRASVNRDERVVLVTIADAGRVRLGAVLPGHVALVERELFEDLSEADVQAMDDVLRRVRDRLRAIPPRSAGAGRQHAD